MADNNEKSCEIYDNLIADYKKVFKKSSAPRAAQMIAELGVSRVLAGEAAVWVKEGGFEKLKFDKSV